MSTQKGLLLRGSAMRTLLLIANVLVAFYMMPFVIHAVGDRWYGMWTLVATFMGYYGYLDFGLSVATQRFIAAAIGRRDHDEVNRLVTTSLWLFLALGLVAFVATLVIAAAAPLFLNDAAEIHVFRVVLVLLGINTAVSLSMAPVNGLITGHLRYDVVTTIQLAKLAVRTGLILYFIASGYSIVALAAITLLADVGANVGKIAASRRMFVHIRPARRFYARERIRELFDYGGKTFVTQLADMFRFQIDQVVIAAFINLSVVTLFNIAGQLVYYFRTLLQALIGVLVPVFAQYQAAADADGMRKAYYFSAKLAAAAGVLVGGAMVVFGSGFIALWMGRAYVDAYRLMVILVLPTILYVSAQPANALLFGVGRVGPLAKGSIVEAGANLGLSLVLAGPLGAEGVALGTAVPLTFFSIFILVSAHRAIGDPFRTYWRRVGPVIAVGAALQVVTWFALRDIAIGGYGQLLGIGGIIYPVQGLLLLLLTFSSEEWHVLWDSGRRALGLS
jgi:O-antigen/teichoic acid export membrane protein